jgi:hypothetical protein
MIEPEAECPKERVDALLDTVGDVDSLRKFLPMVAVRGRVLLLAPAYPQRATIGLYPEVHRRSIAVVGGELWPCPATWGGPGGKRSPVCLLKHLSDARVLELPSSLQRVALSKTEGTMELNTQGQANGLLLQWQ